MSGESSTERGTGTDEQNEAGVKGSKNGCQAPRIVSAEPRSFTLTEQAQTVT